MSSHCLLTHLRICQRWTSEVPSHGLHRLLLGKLGHSAALLFQRFCEWPLVAWPLVGQAPQRKTSTRRKSYLPFCSGDTWRKTNLVTAVTLATWLLESENSPFFPPVTLWDYKFQSHIAFTGHMTPVQLLSFMSVDYLAILQGDMGMHLTLLVRGIYSHTLAGQQCVLPPLLLVPFLVNPPAPEDF